MHAPHDRIVCSKQGRKQLVAHVAHLKIVIFALISWIIKSTRIPGRKHFFASYEFYIFLYSSFISFFYRLINLSLITNITDF